MATCTSALSGIVIQRNLRVRCSPRAALCMSAVLRWLCKHHSIMMYSIAVAMVVEARTVPEVQYTLTYFDVAVL
jgi:hypothetical protein